MMSQTPAGVAAVSPGCRRLAGSAGRSGLATTAGIGLAVLALLAGGCGGGNLKAMNSSHDFQREVLDAKRPVIVLFYKTGCAACSLVEPTLDQLSDDYAGRAAFTKYCLKNWLGGITNWEIRSKYDVRWYPTVILFVNGREKQRWVVHFDVKSYRKGLDAVLTTPPKQATPAAPAPARR